MVLFVVGMLMATGTLSAANVQKFLAPTDDTTLDEHHPLNTENIAYLGLRSNGGVDWAYYPMLKFDLSNIPYGSTILKARLHLYYRAMYNGNPLGHLYKLYRVSQNWNEESACWNNRPTVCGVSSSSQYCPSNAGVWITWTVTSDVQGFVSNIHPNYGWIIKDTASASSAYISIFSKEATGQRAPVLEILYCPPQ